MLTFEESGHVYRYAGKIVPGVTTALSVIEQGFARVDADLIERARQFGQHVHKAIELFNLGELDEDALDFALVPYLNGWKKFLADTGFKVTDGEIALYHPQLRYAGRADIRGTMRGTSWLIDLKSGAVPKTCGAQTSAYQAAFDGVRPRRRAALQLMPDRYNLIEHRDPADFSLFVSALNCWRFLHKEKS